MLSIAESPCSFSQPCRAIAWLLFLASTGCGRVGYEWFETATIDLGSESRGGFTGDSGPAVASGGSAGAGRGGSIGKSGAADAGDGLLNDSGPVDAGSSGGGQGKDRWWSGDFENRQRVTIHHESIGETLSDFPVAVWLTAPEVDPASIDADGSDLRFVDSDGAVLAHELDAWKAGGPALVWVNVPTLPANAVHHVWMYYGNRQAQTSEDADATWQESFKAVWHMNDDLADSSGNRNDGTNKITVAAIGQFQAGRQFDGAGARVIVPLDDSLDSLFSAGGTIETWVYLDSWGEGNHGRIVDKALDGSATAGWTFFAADGAETDKNLRTEWGFSQAGVWESLPESVALARWHYLAMTFDSSAAENTPTFYIDGRPAQGVTEDGPKGSAQSDKGTPLCIGNACSGGRGFHGIIDEVRLSSTPRSSAWIAASHRRPGDGVVEFGARERISGSAAAAPGG